MGCDGLQAGTTEFRRIQIREPFQPVPNQDGGSVPVSLSPSLSANHKAAFPQQFSPEEKFASPEGTMYFLIITGFYASPGAVRRGSFRVQHRKTFSCPSAKHRHPKPSDPNLQPSISSRVGPADSHFLLAGDCVLK